MLRKLEKAQQQWGGSIAVIDNWLEERKQLLVLYCQLSGVQQFSGHDNQLPGEADIKAFCQVMMDYISAGHFEVYDQITSKNKSDNNEEGVSLAEELYPQITQSTDVALTFNDNYAEKNADELTEQFDKDLASLGEALDDRFELEDKLIQSLHLAQQTTE